MKNIKSFLEQNIQKMLLLFWIIGPFIDVLTAFEIYYFHLGFSLGMVVRFFFLLILFFYYGWCFKGRKKKVLIYLGLLIGYLGSFMIMIYFLKGPGAILYELKNTFRSFYFPFLLTLTFPIMEQNKKEVSLKTYLFILGSYLFFIMVPTFFHIGFAAYHQGKEGNIGWFYSTNEISAILSLFLPYVMLFCYKEANTKKTAILKMLLLLACLFCLFTLGTKMTIISLLVTVLVLGMVYVYHLFKKKNYKAIGFISMGLVLLVSIVIILLPKTHFYKNIQIHLAYLGVDNPIEIIQDPKLINHFIFSSRLSFLNNTHQNYRKASLLEKGMGIGYIENYATDEMSLKMVEMDFFDLFYRHGIIGFVLYFIPLFYSVYQIFKKHRKKDLASLCFGISLFLIFFMAFFVGHVFVSPSVSILITLLLANENLRLKIRKSTF